MYFFFSIFFQIQLHSLLACVPMSQIIRKDHVHLDLGWCVCIGNDEFSSCSPGPELVCLWKWRIFLLLTWTWASVSVLEMTNLPLVRLDLGLCVCIGNDESSSCSPGPGLVCLSRKWRIFLLSPGPGLVCLYWKWRIFLLFTWTSAGVSVLEMTNLPLVHLDLR